MQQAHDKHFEWLRRFLLLGYLIQTFIGYSAVFAYNSPLWALHRKSLAQSFWQTETFPQTCLPITAQLIAMLGSTITSGAFVVVLILMIPFKRREPWAWWAVFASMMLWFPVDTGFSIWHQAWGNVIFNVIPFVSVMLPLVLTKKYFKTPQNIE